MKTLTSFLPNWKPENRPLSPSEKSYLWKISLEAFAGTQKNKESIGTKRSLGRRNEAMGIAMELTAAGKKPHNLCGIVAKRMGLKPGTTRNYLGAFIAELKGRA